ncbi:polysaccharide deacetylase family protein [Pedobacter sp. HMF7647]|uniref:Polysaccharide deacetylase family protein n=1 Tax=Hufsiella arboris TaxID=2695275 RepID=A0A7K1YFF7_9SPHI|nr:polysaccharide deacetylase family protein [Hufsiella arboris]MXV52808.1 polysaccharide deacetylase family protein [Hufsiella arboris]
MNIPILMLHHVGKNPDPSGKLMCIDNAKFKLLLDCIESQGYTTIVFEDLIRKNADNAILKKSVIISFDDCSAALFDFAIPELIRRKMRGVFYMPVFHMGNNNSWDIDEFNTAEVKLMDQGQLETLAKAGMEIGSHSYHHIRLAEESEVKCLEELVTSKTILEGILQKPVYSIAYPYSSVPQNYRKLMKSAGYLYGLCIYRAFQNRYTLRRIGIHQSDTKESMIRKLSKTYSWFRCFYDAIKR